MGVTVEVALAAELEVSALGPGEALEESEGRSRVAVALGNGCSHAYVIAGSPEQMRRAVARLGRAVEESVARAGAGGDRDE